MAQILVVDDEAGILDTTRQFLEKMGHDVLTAGDVSAATELIRENHFDVVVSDIVLPGLTGIDLLRTLRNISPYSKTIMMTGQPNLDTATEAVRKGAFDYLSKPIMRDALCKTVEAALVVKALEDKTRNYHEDLEAQVQVRTEKLRGALSSIIDVLCKTVEVRDPYTAGHQRRVTQLATAIATEMELSENTMEAVNMAGLVHDLGKISVPSEILAKPGKITRAEFDLIKQHSQVGYDLLKDVDFDWPVADIVVQHHERIDGSGYPNGLSGDDILLEAKIIAVADVVEAMASHRPYRAALGIDIALEEIADKKGTHFDPEIADACLRIFKDRKFDWAS